MNLKGDRSTLESAARKLRDSDSDGRAIESCVDKLAEAVLSDIQSDNIDRLLNKLDLLRERPLAASNDSDINQAQSMIQKEIRTIDVAIEAQKKAAEALKAK